MQPNERPPSSYPTRPFTQPAVRATPPFATRPPFASGPPAPGPPNVLPSQSPFAPPPTAPGSFASGAPGAASVVPSQSPFTVPGPFASGAPGAPNILRSQSPFSPPTAPGPFTPGAASVVPSQSPFGSGPPAPGAPNTFAPTGPTSTTSQPMRFTGPPTAGPTFQQTNLPRFPSPAQPVAPLQSPYMRAPPVPMGPPMVSSPRSPAQQQNFPQFTNLPPASARPFYQQTQMGPAAQMQYGPPMAGSALNAVVEEFHSLTVGSVPGSVDSGIDQKALPRPLKGDEEPIRVLESYPLNCHPRYFRLTTHALPSSQSLLARWHLPLGAVVHPLAESPDGEEVPVINFGSAGVIRCRRCRTYVNPYVTFTDVGRKWRCNLCQLLNDVPGEYYSQLDHTGRRADHNERPELTKGTVDFLAPTEYMVRPPMPPSYFFIIDVSVASVQSGLLEVVAKTIKSCLDDLPGSSRTQIGFITYDSALHFHNLKSSLSQPQMMVVPDLEDIFLPLPDDLLVNLSESRQVVDAFLDSLPTMFQNNANVESALGPALKAAYMVMGQIGGKLLVFQSNLPSIGVGRLRLRGDDVRAYGTEKEHQLRMPEDPFYKQMAAEFVKNQIAVDVFALASRFCDIASLGVMAKYTGGQVYYYPSFNISTHGEKLRYELARDLTRETAWESVMRVRCGKGVRFTTYHGHFMLRSTDLLALPAVDCDKAFAMQFSLEETLMTTQTVYFQVALLYTSSSGERRIRVHTAAAPVVQDLAEMYRQADTGAIVCLFSRIAVETTSQSKLEDARQMLQLKLIKSLKEYKNMHAVKHRLSGRLIYPDSLKYLMIYVLALVKSSVLRGGYAEVALDERCAAGYAFMVLPIGSLLRLIYPGLYRLDDVLIKAPQKENIEEEITRLPLTVQCLDTRGIYLLNNGMNFVIWLGRMVPPDLINSIFGPNLANFPDLSKLQLSENGSEPSKKLTKIINNLRKKNASCHQLVHVIRQGEQPREALMLLNNLIEDQLTGSPSYLDWVLQIHRQTQGN
ncbi:hypothetical protein LUZ60_010602 [Juncus effusus]|nr:hypothetical protein LUZ60_010602 [Juncus effusus]